MDTADFVMERCSGCCGETGATAFALWRWSRRRLRECWRDIHCADWIRRQGRWWWCEMWVGPRRVWWCGQMRWSHCCGSCRGRGPGLGLRSGGFRDRCAIWVTGSLRAGGIGSGGVWRVALYLRAKSESGFYRPLRFFATAAAAIAARATPPASSAMERPYMKPRKKSFQFVPA